MKIAVIGSNGFIGKNLVNRLRKHSEDEIFSFDIETCKESETDEDNTEKNEEIPFCICLTSSKNKYSFYGVDCVNDFIDFLDEIKTETNNILKQQMEIQSELIKLMLNSCYGFTLCNTSSTKFNEFINDPFKIQKYNPDCIGCLVGIA